MDKEKIKERLLDELADLLDAPPEESFNKNRLEEILVALDELDPISTGTLKSTEESLKEFWAKYGQIPQKE